MISAHILNKIRHLMLIAFPDCLGISRWSQKFWETLGTRPHPKGAGTPNVPKGGKLTPTNTLWPHALSYQISLF